MTKTNKTLRIPNKAALAAKLSLLALAGDHRAGAIAALIEAPTLEEVIATLERDNSKRVDDHWGALMTASYFVRIDELSVGGSVALHEDCVVFGVTVYADKLSNTTEVTWNFEGDLVSELRKHSEVVADFADKCLLDRQRAREWKEYIQSRPGYDAEADREERMAEMYGDSYGY